MNKVNTLSAKILCLLFISGLCSITCFGFFRYHASDYYSFLRKSDIIKFNTNHFLKEFKKKAKNVNLYTKNTEEKQRLMNLINDHDNYTSISIYTDKDQFYIQGYEPSYFKENENNPFTIFSQSLMTLQRDFEQNSYDIALYEPVTFQDAKANIMIVDLHTMKYSDIYFQFALTISLLIFLLPTLLFIHKKVKYINYLKNELSIMEQGNLDISIQIQGKDELAILAQEIDSLRISLDDNIQKELEARNANKELITSLSHDLRTPLTSLRGYLDILSLKKYKNEDQFNKYLKNCIEKVEQIKDLSNKTFEYALVFENHEPFSLHNISSQEFQEYLENLIEYLKLQGFKVQENILFSQNFIQINFNMMKRTLNNLFSNIIKYADKNNTVTIGVECRSNHLKIRMVNKIKDDNSHIESNQIGLKSVKKVITLHNGSFYYQDNNASFVVIINMPC